MDQMMQVLIISLPIFLVIGFGVLLRRTGMLGDAAHRFVTRFVYLFSLPILIFLAIAKQDFADLFDWQIVVSTLGATAVLAGVAVGLLALEAVTFGRIPDRLRGPLAISPWFANLTFLGLPLAGSAYGETGILYVGIINAFTMPVFVVLGMIMLTLGQTSGGVLVRQLVGAVVNPIVLAAVGGVAASLLIEHFGLARWPEQSELLASIWEIVLRSAQMIGDLGLPLALIAIGGALRLEALRHRLGWMSLGTLAKLVAAPALTLAFCSMLPGMTSEGIGTAVLLMGCPLSVAVYVISQQLDTDSEYLAGLLVMTTVGACITIPLWLLVLI